MTRKHFQAIADAIVIARADSRVDDKSAAIIAHQVARKLGAFNGAFDYDRFIAACGVE